MKNYYALALLLLCFANNAQPLRPIAVMVQQLKTRNVFTEYAPFAETAKTSGRYSGTLADYTALQLDPAVLQQINRDQPSTMRLSLPFQGGLIHVELYRVENAVPDFEVQTPAGKYSGYQKGLYYRGIVAGESLSLAAFSFFRSQIIGVVSAQTFADINIGRIKQAGNLTDYIAYSSHDLSRDISLKCGTPDGPKRDNANRVLPGHAMATETSKKVRMYYEMDYNCYAEHNLDLDQTLDWMTAVHNNVSAVYANDGITDLALSEVFVWTTNDEPYDYGFCCGKLYSFAAKRWAFNGDLANYIRGGIGANGFALGLDFTCNAEHGGPTYGGNGPYEESGTVLSFEDFPVYSPMIQTISHEVGHLLGSNHTHACVWNGNNTQIDDCGNVSAFGVPEGVNCYDPTNPIIPENYNGTIMSYCCCTSMAIGFGPQPRQVIIDTIENAPCLGTDGVTSCPPSIQTLNITNVGTNSAELHIDELDATASNWQFRFVPGDWTTIMSNPYTITGLYPKSVYTIEVRQVCDSPFSANFVYSNNIYTSGEYCGETIYDYFSDFYLLGTGYQTTYFPENTNQRVTINFDYVRTDNDGDTLYIHNGPSTSDPVLASYTGINYNVPAATSTHPSGALTFEFVTDGDNGELGWVGHVECVALSVAENEKNHFALYPNPAGNEIYFKSDVPVRTIEVVDALGRIICSATFGSTSGKLDLSRLASGNYVAVIQTESGKAVGKIVKR